MVDTQQYEKYWPVTMEYTDINKDRFIETLRIIKNTIDNSKQHDNLYGNLQHMLATKFHKSKISIRKSINQFVKLGFVEPGLQSYHEKVNDFLAAKSNVRRRNIFSRIVYENSSFYSSVTTPSKKGHLQFLLRTLEEIGSLESDDILALMTVDIEECERGYLNRNELDDVKRKTHDDSFLTRKYNQLSHFKQVLKNLEDLKFHGKTLYFKEDAEMLPEAKVSLEGRDSYLQRIYRRALEHESTEVFSDIACMVEGYAHPYLIASHIKPFIKSEPNEAYDSSNGLLLTRSMDLLFNYGHISFEDDGEMVLGSKIEGTAKEYLKKLRIRNDFLTPQRIKHLPYHRKNVFRDSS